MDPPFPVSIILATLSFCQSRIIDQPVSVFSKVSTDFAVSMALLAWSRSLSENVRASLVFGLFSSGLSIVVVSLDPKARPAR